VSINPVTKTILGSIARHWLGAFLGVIGTRVGLSHDVSTAATTQLTDDMVANATIAFLAAVLPAAWSIGSRLMLLLRARVALLMAHGSTEHQLRNVIAEAPRSSLIAAVLTANPAKL
jgi:hypothetical protein